MTFDPFIYAPVYIQIHAAAAFYALVIGPIALHRQRRDFWHKVVGYSWILSMVVAAVSSFWIHSFGLIGPFSPLHLLAILVLVSVAQAIYYAIKGRFAAHKAVVTNLYYRGLIIAGLFNFLPGRSSNRAVFGENDSLGYVVLGLGLTLVLGDVLRQRVNRTRMA